MWASWPSKKISPLSQPWIPAMHLMRVDLPAPLSPTSAMISPARTSKSTSDSACTEPNDLVMPRSSRSGVVAFTVREFLPENRWGRPIGRPHRHFGLRLAVLLVLADTDLALLQEAAGEQLLVVRLRDPDHGERKRRLVLRAVLAEPVRLGRLAV